MGETAAARYTAFTIGDDGSLGDRRVWAQVAPAPPWALAGDAAPAPVRARRLRASTPRATSGRPTRCGRAAAGRAGRRVVDELPAPDGLGVYACMLGGDDGRTLLMCAAPDFGEAHAQRVR